MIVCMAELRLSISVYELVFRGGFGGGGGIQGIATSPNDQSHSSTTNMLRYA